MFGLFILLVSLNMRYFIVCLRLFYVVRLVGLVVVLVVGEY